MQYPTGYIPRSPDPRDVPYAKVFGSSSFDFASGYDLRNTLELIVEDQGRSQSCVAQSWAKLAEIYVKIKTSRPLDLSSHAIYWRGYIPPGGGMFGYKGGSILKAPGTAKETDAPSYENAQPPSEDFMRTPVFSSVATPFTIPGYLVVNPELNTMATATKSHAAMAFGVSLSNEGWQSGDVRPPLPGEQLFGHFITAIGAGIKNGRPGLWFLNSWSKRWGINGYGFLGQEYFANPGNVYSGFVIDDIPSTWQAQIDMKDCIVQEGTVDQYVVMAGKKYLIPDLETRDFLVTTETILPSARTVTAQEFLAVADGGRFPSVKVDANAQSFYQQLRDSFEPNTK